jgi:hypothetical protein
MLSIRSDKMMELHPHEKAIVEAFFEEGRQERYFAIFNSAQRRRKWLDKLNHTPGLNERYVQWLDNKTDVLATLRSKGAPEVCFVISVSPEIDRCEMELSDALAETEALGWGTVIGCIPGVLGYYVGELGPPRRAILEKPRVNRANDTFSNHVKRKV